MPTQPDLFNINPEDEEITEAQKTEIDSVGVEVKTLATTKVDLKTKVRQFNLILNRNPPVNLIRTHQGYKYLPIRYHQHLAQQLFLGQTKERIIGYSQIFNEICVHGRFFYLHPITGIWLYKDGLGASQIMQDKDTKVSDFALHKKPNALQTCLPKAGSEAFKNATSKLGPLFGRDLNRKLDYDYDASTNTSKPVNQ